VALPCVQTRLCADRHARARSRAGREGTVPRASPARVARPSARARTRARAHRRNLRSVLLGGLRELEQRAAELQPLVEVAHELRLRALDVQRA
jgi:hypothetical protein